MRNIFIFVSILFMWSNACMAREYHVSVNGNDAADGSMAAPLRTINHAAQIALPGDTVTVHEGTYRDW